MWVISSSREGIRLFQRFYPIRGPEAHDPPSRGPPCRAACFASPPCFFLAFSPPCAGTDPDITPSTCEDAGCTAKHRECQTQSGADATCGACLSGYLEENGICTEPTPVTPPTFCERNADICGEGECVDTDEHYTCNCSDGFEFDSTTCVDIDECTHVDDVCGDREECVNTHGSYECACRDGLSSSESGCQPRVLRVSAGSLSACAIMENHQLYCWGSAQQGALGNGEVNRFDAPPTLVQGDQIWRDIQVGWEYACGITTDNDLFCWGANQHGQLGNGVLGDWGTGETTPSPVAGEYKWLQVAVNDFHSCGITEDQKLYCWGTNTYGQLGFLPSGPGGPADPAVLEPRLVELDVRWVEVFLGHQHTCGITTDDEFYCWGHNFQNHLGNNAATVSLPTLTGEQHSWSSIATGSLNTCGVSDGELYCWGDGYGGRTGLGHEDLVTEPTRVGSETGWTTVSVVGSEICALKDEEVYCWGQHSSDFPNTYYLLRPVRLLGNHKWSDIDLGFYNGCGISEGVAYCWGQNEYRQSGYEGLSERLTPKPVQFFP